VQNREKQDGKTAQPVWFRLGRLSFSRFLQRRMIVATAGHIDHGKTLLVRALTGTG